MKKKITKKQEEKVGAKIARLKAVRKAREIPKMNVAAFDQATHCGVAFQLSGTDTFKVELWDLKIKSKESQGMKWIRFESKVKDFFTKHKIQVVAYELPAGRNVNPIIHSAKLICIIEKVATELGIEYIEVSATEVKRFATNNGNANKELMVEFAQKEWGYKGSDDNEADAIHILNLLKSKIN